MTVRPITYLITSGELTAENYSIKLDEFLSSLTAAVDAGVSAIQLRERVLNARLLTALTESVVALARGSDTKVFVNDRADIAAAAAADGVHLRTNSMSCAVVRRTFPSLLIGISTHAESEVRDAMQQGADFVVFGPVFESPGKGEPVGLAELARVAEAVRPFPVLALGGVDIENYRGALLAGAAGFAAIRMFADPSVVRAVYTKSNEH